MIVAVNFYVVWRFVTASNETCTIPFCAFAFATEMTLGKDEFK